MYKIYSTNISWSIKWAISDYDIAIRWEQKRDVKSRTTDTCTHLIKIDSAFWLKIHQLAFKCVWKRLFVHNIQHLFTTILQHHISIIIIIVRDAHFRIYAFNFNHLQNLTMLGLQNSVVSKFVLDVTHASLLWKWNKRHRNIFCVLTYPKWMLLHANAIKTNHVGDDANCVPWFHKIRLNQYWCNRIAIFNF